ncbi:MAG TPA: TIGR00266 family protein [Patescibacteria group bacterium]|nr:TIGR00266 family protein [Patescibacteria group bacterium]
MKCEIMGDSAFPLLRVTFGEGENIKAESGAMVAMSTNIRLTGKADGGIGKALGRLFSGESFFMQQLEAQGGPGWALLAAGTPGEIATIDLRQGEQLSVQKGGYLAATPGIEVSTKVQGLFKGMMSGQGFFIVKIGGEGTVFLSTYGSIYPMVLREGEVVHIDNGHLVAWDSHMPYEIVKGGAGWISSMTSGEGLGCRFQGPGRVWIQTRNPQQLVGWLYPMFPQPSGTR